MAKIFNTEDSLALARSIPTFCPECKVPRDYIRNPDRDAPPSHKAYSCVECGYTTWRLAKPD